MASGHITHFVNVGTRKGAQDPFTWTYWTDDLEIIGATRHRANLESDVFEALARRLGVSDDSTFDFKLVFNQTPPWRTPLQRLLE